MVPTLLLNILQAGIPFAAALTAFRLRQTDLHRRYPVLFTYMVFVAIYQFAPSVMDLRGKMYFWTWVVCQPVQWALDILVVRELCRVVLEKHPGLVTLGRWGMYTGVIISAFLSYLSLLPQIHSTTPARSKLVAYWVAAGRGVTLGLAIFLILMLFALSRYPVHLSKNVILNAFLFTLVFLSDSLEAILRTVFDRRMNPWVAASVTAAEVAWLLLWFFRLRPDGEYTQFSWIRFGADYERRVLERLDTINRIMGGFGIGASNA
jgi:hypothetical protein